MEERRKARRMKLESTITVRRIDSGIDEEVTIVFCTEMLEVGSIYQSSIIIWTKEIIPVLLKIVREVDHGEKKFYGAEFMGLSEIDMFRIEVYEELEKSEIM